MSNFKRHLLSWADVVAVLALAVLPPLTKSLFHLLIPTGQAQFSFDELLIQLIVRSFQVSLPILLIIHLRKASWKDYGFVGIRPTKDVAIASGLTLLSYILFYLAFYLLVLLKQDFTSDVNQLEQMSMGQPSLQITLPLIFAASIANGFAEELAMRSYLITRLSQLMGSEASAVILTTALFSLYHAYQGRYGIISALLIGLVLGFYFVRTRRFWPIAIAHAFMDIIPLALMAFPPE